MTEKGKKAGVGLGMFGGAGLVGLLASLSLTTCLIAVLATQMKVWIAALIVTVVYGAIAGALALQGKNRVAEATPPVPEQTVESVKEDVQWAKTQVAIREEIEQTRERMGDTVDALGYKADVPARAKESLNDRVDTLKSKFTGVTGNLSDATPDSGDFGRRRSPTRAGVAQENPARIGNRRGRGRVPRRNADSQHQRGERADRPGL